MVATPPPVLPAELEQAIQVADPAAFLVEPRVLRRLIKYDRRITSLGLNVPHRKSYVVSRPRLLEIVDVDELRPRRDPPQRVILLPQPDDDLVATLPREELLLRYWRLLFHARIHLELETLVSGGRLTLPDVKDRIHRLGQAEFDEIRTVLRTEQFLLPPRDDVTTYIEFAAVFLEQRFFAPSMARQYFPALDGEAAEQLLSQDLDAAAIFESTRLPGAAEPRRPISVEPAFETSPSAPVADAEPAWSAAGVESPLLRDQKHFRSLNKLARAARIRGNVVRAALLHARSAALTTRSQGRESWDEATSDLDRLAARLQAALSLPPSDLLKWRAALRPLLEPAAEGRWASEARLLYDLQKVCVDRERPIYRVDLLGWLTSLGRRPLRRDLPLQREVLLGKHLRSATRRLRAARVTDAQRQALAALLHRAAHHAETSVRDRLRPILVQSLDDVGLVPRLLVEENARQKLCEELLDRVVERGYLRFGDLRDAVSRNQLKLDDIRRSSDEPAKPADATQRAEAVSETTDEAQSRAAISAPSAPAASSSTAPVSTTPSIGQRVVRAVFWINATLLHYAVFVPLEVVRGDRLLRADKLLAARLDGVYHRAEAYLRWFQRLSSLAFGNPLGRWLTRYVALPLGGAYMLLEFANYIAHHLAPLFVEEPAPVDFARWYAVAATALWLLLLINMPAARDVMRRMFRLLWSVIRTLVSAVVRVLTSPVVLRILKSRVMLLVRRYAVKPLLFAALIWQLLTFAGYPALYRTWQFAAVYLALALILNSRAGRDLEEVVNDNVARAWLRFRVHVLAGLYYAIVDFFRAMLEYVDRSLYAVDEWLRFKTGESRVSFWSKAVLGVAWFGVTYLIRFVITLLVEPQINPLKHFPVVTVSHKLLLPTMPFILNPLLAPLVGTEWAVSISWGVATAIPGVFGFLAWELKENWRLYEANRSPSLDAAIVGSHGETMLRLLKPGFHSGTLPKLFKKLRKAERKSFKPNARTAARKHHEALEHVREAVERFVDRDLIGLLADVPAWPYRLERAHVLLSTNTIRIELLCRRPAGDSPPAQLAAENDAGALRLSFEEQSGFLLARVLRDGWLQRLPPHDLEMFRNALLGFYKQSGVDLVAEQVQSLLPGPAPTFDIGLEGLVVWPDRSYAVEYVYDLGQTRMRPLVRENRTRGDLLRGDLVRGEVLREELSAGDLAHTAGIEGEGAAPSLVRRRLMFSEQKLLWGDWAAAWELAQATSTTPMRLLPEARVLPTDPDPG